jgi:hypothetical protein
VPTASSFSTTFGQGWQVAGELRPDVAQSIAVQFGARIARVGLPVTLSAWHLIGRAVRAADLWGAAADAPMPGLALNGHAIKRAVESKKHELHLDRASLEELLDRHGPALDEGVLPLLTGLQLKPDAQTDRNGKPIVMYAAVPLNEAGHARTAFKGDDWLRAAANAERIIVFLWCAG